MNVMSPIAVPARPAETLHIACYLPDLSGGGVERMRINLLGELARLGVRTTLLLHAERGALMTDLPPETERVVFGTARTAYDILPLARYLRRARPDALLTSLGHNNIVAMAAKLLARSRCNLIVCQHNALSHEARGGGSYAALPLLYRLLSPMADHIVAVSEGVADDMATCTGIARHRITVIPNPVIGPDFAARSEKPIDDPWFAPGSPPVYVTAGRLVAQKDHELLLRAFALARRSCDARLMILGEGPLHEKLVARAEALGIAAHVRFLGFVADPLPYMRHASAFVLSSLHEGFGNVLVEALACGTPAISTDCPHGPSEILQRGLYGRLVAPGDHVALGRALDPGLRAIFPPETLRAHASSFTVEAASQLYLGLARAKRDTRARVDA